MTVVDKDFPMTFRLPEPSIDSEARVAMTLRCRDADDILKVPDAGKVVTTSDGTAVQVMHTGLLVKRGGYYGESIERIITSLRGHHEPQEERAFHEVLKHIKPDATMVELGAFWSYFTLWFMQGHTGRRAVAMEPDPNNRAVGQINARLNDLAPMFVAGFAGRETTDPRDFATDTAGIVQIPCLSVPTLMEKAAFHHLDVLHCDTQGAELGVLEGCAELFREGRVTWCCISTHAKQISGDWLTHQRCVALLEQAGADIVIEHDVHESFSGDGFILAKFGGIPSDWQPFTLSRNRYSESLFRNPIFDLAAI